MRCVLFLLFLIIFVYCDECGPDHWEFFIASMEHRKIIAQFPKEFKDFVFLSKEEHSKFADPITIKYAKINCFAEKQDINIVDISSINETSIANIAYMALHSNYIEEFSKEYDYMMIRVKDYLLNK